MPTIVIGADTPVGVATIEAIRPRTIELRAFVSTQEAAAGLRTGGVIAAVGDVSDGSHVAGAAFGAFCAVLVNAAATDGRETHFAPPDDVVAVWLKAMVDAGVTRVILVSDTPVDVPPAIPESAVVATAGRLPEEVAEVVAFLEDAAALPFDQMPTEWES
ncbi:MAG: NAD(P)H-binding protein [Acidimicrobiia bacterium]|nr:MAG: NAD(P)H-binding protein [Acidimicrobiia bacterium]